MKRVVDNSTPQVLLNTYPLVSSAMDKKCNVCVCGVVSGPNRHTPSHSYSTHSTRHARTQLEPPPDPTVHAPKPDKNRSASTDFSFKI